MNAPCKDCKDRAVGCHGSCEQYKAFRAERDRMLEEKQRDAFKRSLRKKRRKRFIFDR